MQRAEQLAKTLAPNLCSLLTMVEPTAEQLAAANAQVKRLSATLEERDRTISELRRENKELSETVAALQAQTLVRAEQEARLISTVRGLARGSQPVSSNTSGLT